MFLISFSLLCAMQHAMYANESRMMILNEHTNILFDGLIVREWLMVLFNIMIYMVI